MSQTREIEFAVREIAGKIGTEAVNLAWSFESLLNSLYDSAYSDGYESGKVDGYREGWDEGHFAGLEDAERNE